MSAPKCVRCGQPTADALICHPDALRLAESLRKAAGHAEDAEAVLSRQTRYTAGGSGGSSEPLPVDLAAADRLRAISNTMTTWARLIAEETNGAIWVSLNPNPIAEAALWLASHVDHLRQHPAADEAFDELDRACRDLERLVDRPADKELVGMCDCGKILYAAHGRLVATCSVPTCRLPWDVEKSRAVLRNALREKLLTAAEAAHLAAHWDGRSSEQIRKLINKWVERSRLIPHGEVDDDPVYAFGEVIDKLAASPRRQRAAA